MGPNGWFHRRPKIQGNGGESKAQDIPEGLWTKCPQCGEALLTKELEKNLKVCRKCGYHFRLTAPERIELLTDADSFTEIAAGLESVDLLQFPNYPEKLAKSRAKTGLNDGMTVGLAKMAGWPVVLGVADFRFIGGSMGSVYGERVTRALEEAVRRQLPAIMVCASGGARMYEGLTALMQMAKTSAAVARMNQAKLPYITVLTDPTTAGVLASFASLGDIIIAEPAALVRFAGERVAQQAGPNKQVPDNFQTAEFYLEHGTVDIIAPRKELRETLVHVLTFCCQGRVRREAYDESAAAIG
ncbi:MAG TPA: acetyl-CoA carboxylase, carboxyltransferase subunit beta [Armatimonadota bacterium]|nr:acetyl-CoA carboxylase, carboxyltransferase subunit beta [Armatimonadota bacterium]